MAKKRNKEYNLLPPDTLIDVVARNGSKVIVKPMKMTDWLNLNLDWKTGKKLKGKSWKYDAFAKGFHSYKNTEK